MKEIVMNTYNDFRKSKEKGKAKYIKEDIKKSSISFKKWHVTYIFSVFVIGSIILITTITSFQTLLSVYAALLYGTITFIKQYLIMEKKRNEARNNLRNLSCDLLRADVETSCEDLQKAIVLEKKDKIKVVHGDIDLGDVVHIQTEKNNINDIYFYDIENQLRCLREVKKVIKTNGDKEVNIQTYLLSEDEYRNALENPKVKKIQNKI